MEGERLGAVVHILGYLLMVHFHGSGIYAPASAISVRLRSEN